MLPAHGHRASRPLFPAWAEFSLVRWAQAAFALSTLLAGLQLVGIFSAAFDELGYWFWFTLWLLPCGLSLVWLTVWHWYKYRLQGLARRFSQANPGFAPPLSFMRIYAWLNLPYRATLWLYLFRWWIFVLISVIAQLDTLRVQSLLVCNIVMYYVEFVYFAALFLTARTRAPIVVTESGEYRLYSPVFGSIHVPPSEPAEGSSGTPKDSYAILASKTKAVGGSYRAQGRTGGQRRRRPTAAPPAWS